MTFQNMSDYEELEELRVKGMLHAEKKCQKLKMGACKWSPKFEMARKKCNTLSPLSQN